MRLETERLVLRPPRLEDARAFDPFWQDEEAAQFVGGVKGPEDVDAVMERTIQHWDWYGVGNFTVERGADGAVLGRVGFLVWDPETWENGYRVRLERPYETELGWKLDRDAWGQGYATEAALACRDWALEQLGLQRVISLIALENAPSIRVAERIGETFERELHPSPFPHPAGVWALGERMAP